MKRPGILTPRPPSRPHWQSGEIGNNEMVLQILMTSPEMDAQPKPPAGPTVQLPSATDRAGFNSSQGGTRGAYGQPPVTSAAKGRYKASVEDDPDSPGNAFTTSAQVTAPAPPSRPTPTSKQPTSGYTHPSTSLRPATGDHATVRTSPPSRAKDVPSHRAIESAPVPPVDATYGTYHIMRTVVCSTRSAIVLHTVVASAPSTLRLPFYFPSYYTTRCRFCSDCCQTIH